MLRYQDQMPLDRSVTHRFGPGQAQQAMATALGHQCMRVVLTPVGLKAVRKATLLLNAEYGHCFDFDEQIVPHQSGRVYGGAGR